MSAEPGTRSPAADGDAPIAVTVLGGYLGAGKTTLVNHVLRRATERTVVLVNDFGAVSIDEELIETRDGDTITLANGCICCSLADGLAAALEEVRAIEPRPARLLIEASGVGDPAAIAAYAHGRSLRLDGVVTVVDAETVRARSNDRYVGDVVVNQIDAADVIVINKVDLITDEQRHAVRSWLARRDERRPLVEAVQGQVPLDVLLGADSEGSVRDGGRATVPDARAMFETASFAADGAFDLDALRAAIDALPAGIVRVKGVVRMHGAPDRRVVVHRVGARVTMHDDGGWRGGASQVVAIGLVTGDGAPQTTTQATIQATLEGALQKALHTALRGSIEHENQRHPTRP